MRRVGIALSALMVTAALATGAAADRKATPKEEAQLAALIELPVACARVRISTVTEKAKWGSARWKPKNPSRCKPLARAGVTIAKRQGGRWRPVAASDDFTCPGLYKQVPKAVVKDLNIFCH